MRKVSLGKVSLAAGSALLAGGLAAFQMYSINSGCATEELRAEYFGNPDLQGAPVMTRCEAYIDMDWQFGGPIAPAALEGVDGAASDQGSRLPDDGFSVRWIGEIRFDQGDYNLTAGSDDGMRVWIDDRLVIDRWIVGPYREETTKLHLDEGVHSVRVEYYENTGAAMARVTWAAVN
jgi:PA14 domain